MKPKKKLKPTPASSPLLRSRHLDSHGEPTHPDIVRDPSYHDSLPEDDAYYDPDLSLGPCLCKRGVGITRAFWFWFDDGARLGMLVRSDSYSEGAKAARAEFERHPELSPGAKIVRLARVDVYDGLSETRQAVAALRPRTRW